MIIFMLVIGVCFLAFTNGANDNFKGVATLLGSQTTHYRNALRWATVTTFAGSVCSIFFAQILVKNFSGKGLVPDHIAGTTEFLLAVAVGAALTVMLATQLGFPISTTHSITGALFGAGLMATGGAVNFVKLGKTFFLPLFFSPSLAVILAVLFYIIFRHIRLQMGVTKQWCICVGSKEQIVPIPQPQPGLVLSRLRTPEIFMASQAECRQRYVGKIMGIQCDRLLDIAHFFSAGLVSFARGLNDTPKIFALLLACKMLAIETGMFIVAIGIAVGGLLKARKVAETMSHKITRLNQGQGFTANLVTGLLVIFASRMGVPVSTTHVSCGSLFGLGLVTGRANKRMISGIILSWLLTLPIAVILSAVIFKVLSTVY